MGANQIVKFFFENSLILPIFSPVLRSECGAGITNFYITEEGLIYPCKYLKEIPIGNIKEFFNPFSMSVSEKPMKEPNCKDCFYLKLCGGICKALQNGNFGKICKFYRKILDYYISNVSLKALKEASDKVQAMEEKKDLCSKREGINKLMRRLLCPIGTF